MGCDLHAVVVTRLYPERENDRPDAIMTFSEPRDYALFSAMADVRNAEKGEAGYIEPIAEARGRPTWVHWEKEDGVYVNGDVWLGDHSYSWLTTAEFAEAIKRAEASERYAGFKCDERYHAALAFMQVMQSAGKESWLVFGFDN